jgi:hypothetical protein
MLARENIDRLMGLNGNVCTTRVCGSHHLVGGVERTRIPRLAPANRWPSERVGRLDAILEHRPTPIRSVDRR